MQRNLRSEQDLLKYQRVKNQQLQSNIDFLSTSNPGIIPIYLDQQMQDQNLNKKQRKTLTDFRDEQQNVIKLFQQNEIILIEKQNLENFKENKNLIKELNVELCEQMHNTFSYEQAKIDQIVYKDIYQHLQQRNQLNQSKIYDKQDNQNDKIWHKTLYDVQQRKDSLNSLFGIQVKVPKIQIDEKSEKWITISKQSNYNRLAAIFCCTFNFQSLSTKYQNDTEEKELIQLVDDDIKLIFQVLITLSQAMKNSSKDQAFKYEQNIDERISTTPDDQKKIKELQFFNYEINKSISNIVNEQLRDNLYKRIIKIIIEMMKGINYNDDPYITLIYNFFRLDEYQFQQYLIKDNNSLTLYDKYMLSLLYCDNKQLNQFEQQIHQTLKTKFQKTFEIQTNNQIQTKQNYDDQKVYPQCSVCYNPILEQQYIVCAKCNHGGHNNHINDWFSIFSKCPYKLCTCECSYKL